MPLIAGQQGTDVAGKGKYLGRIVLADPAFRRDLGRAIGFDLLCPGRERKAIRYRVVTSFEITGFVHRGFETIGDVLQPDFRTVGRAQKGFGNDELR